MALLASIIPLLLMLFISSAWGQPNLGITHDTSHDTLPRETFVPFTRQGNLIIVNASINGKQTPMIFDTGAAGCLFSTTTLKSLGINLPANLQSATVAGVGTKRQTQAWIMPIDLKLGSIERRQFIVHINDNALNFPLLGASFLQGFEYTINTDANIIQFKLVANPTNKSASPPRPTPHNRGTNTLTAGNTQALTNLFKSPRQDYSAHICNLASSLTSKPVITVDANCHYIYTVPFIEYNGAIIILVTIGGKGCPMILDTGTNICVFSNDHIKQLDIRPRFTGQVINAKGVAGYMKAPLCIFDQAQFGPITDHLVCLVSDQAFLPRPLLGQNFFSKWELTIDHAHSVIKFVHK